MTERLIEAFSWLIAAILVLRWIKTIRPNRTRRTYRVYENRIEMD